MPVSIAACLYMISCTYQHLGKKYRNLPESSLSQHLTGTARSAH
ncbi:MAG: hypothetical protein QNK29_15740 [Desulfobacterales bacterium]|nr:hypothetical protein [Desulfobacterales bacterium]